MVGSPKQRLLFSCRRPCSHRFRPLRPRTVVIALLVFVPSTYLCYEWTRPVDDAMSTRDGRRHEVDNANGDLVSNGMEVQRATVESRVTRSWQADERAFNPSHDGWESESFAAAAANQLNELARLAVQPTHLTPAQVARYLAHSFQTSPLRPSDLEEMECQPHLVIRRAKPSTKELDSNRYEGAQGLCQALSHLVEPLREARNLHVHAKVVHVEIERQSAATVVKVETQGRIESGMVQQNMTWACEWDDHERPSPRLLSVGLIDYEEAVTHNTSDGAWFADCTASVLGRNRSFEEQVAYGLNHWLRRIERVHRMQIYARTGLAIGDANGDELDDLYLCQPGGLPNRLYLQNADGTATDRSRDAGVDWLDHSSAALFVDFDNDGDQDLAFSTAVGLVLMQNDGSGRFELQGRLAVGRSSESVSAADFDDDGDLDLFVCVYRGDSSGKRDDPTQRFVFHDANNGGMNRLFRNDISKSRDGTWRFVDVTRAVGLGSENQRWSLAASWEDYDNDGDQDLYVANDYGQNCLYRNDNGQFVDVAKSAGVVDFGPGMSVSWGDYNRDGQMDLYIGNMFSSAGNRITTQTEFKPNSSHTLRTLYRRFAKGNSLYRNVGDGRFQEVGDETGIEMARWAWSSLLVDINNDGWQDAVVANGFITADDSRDL